MVTSTKQDDPLVPRRELTYASAWGVGRLVVADGLPLELELPDGGRRPLPVHGAPAPWVVQLERYFAGERVEFNLDVDAHAAAHGLTDFERDVYRALSRVPYGSAVSYRDLAAAAGRPNAYRAVGSAMARNLLPVILPCHRVVKNDGRLGYYGDGPAWKSRLLALEGVPVHGARLAEVVPS
jgi:methylated-DNA-[protein]-cysteine S-methyltransferase